MAGTIRKVHLTLLTADEGGRRNPIFAGYRPHFVSVSDESREYLGVQLLSPATLANGASAECDFLQLYEDTGVGYHKLVTGTRVEMVEGAQVVGTGIIVE